MVRVKINVSGVKYEFDRSILTGKENETLSKLCEDAPKSGSMIEIVVDRPVDSFQAILSYYQTGELHMPQTVCPKAFKKELAFWRVSPTTLESCCVYRYYQFFDDLETRERFRNETFHLTNPRGDTITMRTENKITRLRRKIWNIIDYQERTIRSKIYLAIVFCMILLCILTLALSTVKSMQRKLKRCEMLEYLENSDHEYFDTVETLFGAIDCSGQFFEHSDELDDHDFEYNDENGSLRIIHLPPLTARLFAFDVLEYIAAVFFTLDLLLRIGTCPSLLNFFKSILNIFDILAIVAFYLHIIVIHIFMKDHKYQMSWIKAIGYLQLFRVMRLFRVVKNIRASRVLTFSLKSNAKDMSLLVLLILIVVSFFGSLLYFIEKGQSIESIPEAWYLTMITLTTVGYGDITPITAGGRFVATILSICGVLLLAITLPMFVNNFLSLYQFSCMDEMLEEHKRRHTMWKKALHTALASMNKNKDNTNTDELEEVGDVPIIVTQNVYPSPTQDTIDKKLDRKA